MSSGCLYVCVTSVTNTVRCYVMCVMCVCVCVMCVCDMCLLSSSSKKLKSQYYHLLSKKNKG